MCLVLSIYHSRKNRLNINVIITGDLPGIVAVHFNDLREIIIYGIELQLMFTAPGDSFIQGFPGAAGPEDELVAGGMHLLKVFN